VLDPDPVVPIRREDNLGAPVETVGKITADKDAEEALRDEVAFRESIINSATDGICVCHEVADYPYVRFTTWNRRMVEVTGYTLSQINRVGWYQSLYPDPEVQARARERMEKMRSGSPLREEEWEITRADGTRRLVAISTSVVTDEGRAPHVLAVVHDLTDRKRAEEALRRTLQELKARTRQMEITNRDLTEANIALKVLLKNRDEEREEMRHSILSNLRHLILPYLDKLRKTTVSQEQSRYYSDIIEKNLNEMASSFIWELSNKYLSLTPTEIRIAELLKKGRSTKEIAEEIGVAPSTINTHRESLRRKLGLTGKNTNLATFLRTLK
jgi:PAS domain S-box-containing protein